MTAPKRPAKAKDGTVLHVRVDADQLARFEHLAADLTAKHGFRVTVHGLASKALREFLERQ